MAIQPMLAKQCQKPPMWIDGFTMFYHSSMVNTVYVHTRIVYDCFI